MSVKVKVTTGVLVGIVVGVLGGAMGITWLHPPVDTSAIDNATKSVMVTAEVEDKPVRDLFSVQAQVRPEIEEPVVLATAGEGARQIVSGKVHAVGSVLHFGDVVAEVSGRPVFAVPSWLPIYRDITENAEGSDVDALQQMLQDIGLYLGSVGGKAGPQTMAAITKLYTRAGYAAPDPKGLLMSDTAVLSADGLAVASAAPVGSELSEDTPMVTVVTAPAVILARVDMIQAQGFPVGTSVMVQIGSASPMVSEVTAVGDFQEGTVSQPAGYDITVTIPDGVDSLVVVQEPVIVSESGDLQTGPAVPLTAIRRDSAGSSYVLVPGPSDQTPMTPTRVAVSVTGQTAGWAVIQENPDLPVGATVIVSGD